MAVRDAFRLFFDKTRLSRGMATLAAGLMTGGLLSFVYYPALAAQLSPKEVFESYQRLHKREEPLGLLGVGGKSATYYSGGDVKMLTDVPSAFTWLRRPATLAAPIAAKERQLHLKNVLLVVICMGICMI